VADAITAMVHADPGIGFLEGGVQTTRGFVLGRRSPEDPAFPGYLDRVRTPGRRAVGNAFWELHRTLRFVGPDLRLAPKEVTKGARLLLAWLGLNRVTEAHERLFGPAGDLLVELVLVDDLLEGDGVLANGSPNDREIRAAFLRMQLFDPQFIRGDADGDGRLNLTDLFAILGFLFAFAPDEVPFHDCMNALDADDSSEVDLGDVLFLANWLFLNEAGAIVLPRPGAVCGFERGEPWEPTNIGCCETSCPSDLPE
jgi:hypothetical protein